MSSLILPGHSAPKHTFSRSSADATAGHPFAPAAAPTAQQLKQNKSLLRSRDSSPPQSASTHSQARSQTTCKRDIPRHVSSEHPAAEQLPGLQLVPLLFGTSPAVSEPDPSGRVTAAAGSSSTPGGAAAGLKAAPAPLRWGSNPPVQGWSTARRNSAPASGQREGRGKPGWAARAGVRQQTRLGLQEGAEAKGSQFCGCSGVREAEFTIPHPPG